MNNRDKLYNAIRYICLVTLPIVFLCAFVLGNEWRRWALINDNYRQWLPIMNRALEHFFHGDGMPLYNFYNYEGVEIFDEGYYGLYNPLIWFAFLIGRLFEIDTITLYNLVCILLGNIAVLLLGKHICLDEKLITFMIWAYTFAPIMFIPQNWYYTWMNFWIIPMVVLEILRWRDNSAIRGILGTGIVLLMALLSGNSQYTMMIYMTYGTIGLFVVLVNKGRYFLKYIGSIMMCMMLGIPYIVGLLAASSRSTVFSANNFLGEECNPLSVIIFSFLPYAKGINDRIVDMIFPHIRELKWGYDSDHMYLGIMVIGIVAFVVSAIRSRKRSYEMVVAVGCMITLGLWLLYIGGRDYYLALFLSHIPVINGFRKLYKAIFVMPAVCLFPSMLGLKEITQYKNKLLYTGCIFLLAFAFVEQIAETKLTVQKPYREYDYSYIDNIDKFDKNNYRVLFISGANNNRESIDVIPFSQANVMANIQTVGGFELTYGKIDDAIRSLYADVDFRGLSHDNGIGIDVLMDFLQDENNRDRFIEALSQNSVGYIMTEDANLEPLMRLIRENEISSECIYDDEVIMYSLSGIPSIARDSNGVNLSIDDIEIDKITCMLEGSEQYITVNERYNKHLVAYTDKENDFGRLYLNVSDSNGKLRVDVSGVCGNVIITYRNWIYLLGVWLVPIFVLVGIVVIMYDIKRMGH